MPKISFQQVKGSSVWVFLVGIAPKPNRFLIDLIARVMQSWDFPPWLVKQIGGDLETHGRQEPLCGK